MSALNTKSDTAHAAQFSERIWLSYEHVQGLAIAIDIGIIVFASVISGMAYHAIAFFSSGDVIQYSSFGVLMSFVLVGINQMRNMYVGEELLDAYQQIRRVIVNLLITFCFLTSLAFTLKISELISRGYMFVYFVVSALILIASRLAWRRFLRTSLERGSFVRRSILTVSDNSEQSDAALEELQRYGHMPVSRFLLPAGEASEQIIQNIVKQISTAARQMAIDEIVIAASMNRLGVVTQFVDALRCLPLPVRVAVGDADSTIISRPLHKLGNILSFQVQRHPLSVSERAFKRLFDISVALIAILVLAIMMLATALLIKATSPGPVLFKQMRFGANGRKFQILKFRSMTVASQQSEFRQASRDDARVTWVGRFIRRSSIDELPQLWNVLRGDMSIVGPRPHAVAHDEAYEDLISRYAMRRFMKPGLTGWAQVNGSRGETPTVDSMALRVQYDLWYIDNWSLWLDTLIVIRTAVMLCNPRDVY